MVTTTADRASSDDAVRTPSVLAVLVVRNGLPWLRDCLQSLAAQTHPRLGVLAVDNASTDGSVEMLERSLGPGRVLRSEEDRGLAGALRAALEVPAAQAADYLLVLHDDTALSPDAVARMVEAAQGIQGVERVGVVGPKVVDWSDPRVLREVGRSTDRFGHPSTPLQEGELDHGQYDRVLEVLYVSSCAMLISRAAWQRTGALDERLAGRHDDLDFCWRARVAGFRVLMTPLAHARHFGAGARGARGETPRRRGAQYYAERAALASMLKNYGLLSLAWLLPLHVVIGLVRLAYLALARRFEEALELLAAWTWNLVHLPSTLRRRVRAQSVRSTRDRVVRRFMESAWFRLPRWFQAAEQLLEEQLEEEREHVRIRTRAASLAVEHPALVTWVLAALVGVMAFRELVGPGVLQGGVLAAFPARAGDFFRELASAVRTTGLGGTEAASPALAPLGIVSGIPFASPALAQKVVLAALPPIAGIVMYRSLLRQTGLAGASCLGAVAYVLSAGTFWAFSEGRIDLLVAVAVLPAVADRLESAFAADDASGRWRAAVGLGTGVAVGVVFLPGLVPALALLSAVQLVGGRHRIRGSAIALGGAVVAAALAFPLLPTWVHQPGASFSSTIGSLDFGRLSRLAPGGGPGTWVVAWFLPVAAILAFSVLGPGQRARGWRAAGLGVGGVFLAWLSSAGYLPDALANAPAYLTVSAVGSAVLVGLGMAALGSAIVRHAFGYPQIAAALLVAVLGVGFAGQAAAAVVGGWEVGPSALPAAWPVVQSSPGPFRVLWVGRAGGDRFPAPGGDPQGVVDAGSASLRFAVTGRDGVSALDLGRGPAGRGYAYAAKALAELLAGQTSHAGALLAPLGIRFVVAAGGDLPPAALDRLDAQVDLDVVYRGELVIFQNARSLPPAFATRSTPFARAVRAEGLGPVASVPPPATTPLLATPQGLDVPEGEGIAYLAQQYDPGWRARSPEVAVRPERAFGWAMAFPDAGGTTIVFARQWVRTLEVALLAVLWVAALWVTRRRAAR
ncbi:MAG: glycosyltransferase family 2 protein [Candidatus Velamenicoccus archaeovorus]